ncbi:MAG: hypothetical protein FLDDKLPJ_01238 [Phycisphaerae bacterium]|nr:hypothetical protein [Phycisphaerae bacterium]
MTLGWRSDDAWMTHGGCSGACHNRSQVEIQERSIRHAGGKGRRGHRPAGDAADEFLEHPGRDSDSVGT